LYISANGTSRRFDVGAEPVTIGRQIANMVVIEDTEASRFHCVVEKVAAGFRVRDLGSRNGTKVNGKIVKVALLEDGDVVTIGKTELKLVLSESTAQEARSGGRQQAASSSARGLSSAVTQIGKPSYPISTSDDGVEDESGLDFLPPPSQDKGYDPGAGVEELGEEDFGPSDSPRGGGGMGGGPDLDSGPPTDSLLRIAEALPEKAFNHYDIALINARGGLAHPAGAPKKKDEPVAESVTLLRLLLLVCFRTRASDIHIEPKNDIYLVRVRIDGIMVDAAKLKKEMGIRLCAVIKVISDIDIAQKNIVQEGHFTTRVPDRRVDYRVSFTPAMYGQKCVVRVLDAANAPRYLWDLGLPEWMFNDIDRTIRGDSGMVLVCGPTGSGKTASLYATLRSIDTGERNVITIEDPVEIQIEGITQIPVDEGKGNTFAALLRSVLRQDPDVILVGEIRDAETARTAIQSGMTGHLVFSTVHARDTVGTVFRLLDLGIEPYLVASGLQLVMAQRLVRKLCPHCRVGLKPNPEQSAKLEAAMGQPVARIFRSAGCPRCLHTGFAGRCGLFELLTITEAVRDAISRNPTPSDVYKALADTKFVKLMNSGYRLVAEGITTMDEVERVVGL
jgi:general secretion pathway protein E